MHRFWIPAQKPLGQCSALWPGAKATLDQDPECLPLQGQHALRVFGRVPAQQGSGRIRSARVELGRGTPQQIELGVEAPR